MDKIIEICHRSGAQVYMKFFALFYIHKNSEYPYVFYRLFILGNLIDCTYNAIN
jgi:hypothetical protein